MEVWSGEPGFLQVSQSTSRRISLHSFQSGLWLYSWVFSHFPRSFSGWRSQVKFALCPVVISSSRVVALDTGIKCTQWTLSAYYSNYIPTHWEHKILLIYSWWFCCLIVNESKIILTCVLSVERLRRKSWNKVPKLKETPRRSTGNICVFISN